MTVVLGVGGGQGACNEHQQKRRRYQRPDNKPISHWKATRCLCNKCILTSLFAVPHCSCIMSGIPANCHSDGLQLSSGGVGSLHQSSLFLWPTRAAMEEWKYILTQIRGTDASFCPCRWTREQTWDILRAFVALTCIQHLPLLHRLTTRLELTLMSYSIYSRLNSSGCLSTKTKP